MRQHTPLAQQAKKCTPAYTGMHFFVTATGKIDAALARAYI